MQKKLINKNDGVPKFNSEEEEANWMRSAAGRRHFEQHGKPAKGPAKVPPTDPALLQELMARAKAKRTEAVSLRIPVSDIEAAKRIGAQTGLGYQTVLKEIISRGLR
jgi:hypothetical protein